MKVSISQFSTQNSLKKIPKQINIKSCNRQALSMCVNQNCQKQSIFTCGAVDCQCHQEHATCSDVKLRNIVKLIESKVLQQQEMIDFIDTKIQNIINEVSQLNISLCEMVKSKLKYSQLYDIEKEFLDVVYSEEKNQRQFTAKDSALLWRLSKQKEENRLFKEVKEVIIKFQKSTEKKTLFIRNELNQMIQKEKAKNSKNLDDRKDKQIWMNLKQVLQGKLPTISSIIDSKLQIPVISSLSQSSIIKSVEDAVKLLNFFQSPIKKISLVYKASAHDFSLSKYYEVCGLMTNTLILCESNKGKIVGGFTPLNFYEKMSQSCRKVKDESCLSFMFSLSNNEKFEYYQGSCAIRRYRQKNCICLGNQIRILDKANSNPQNQLRFNINYHNNTYKQNDKDSYIKFNGNQSYNCTLNEWQVWKNGRGLLDCLKQKLKTTNTFEKFSYQSNKFK